jgi:glutaredoxin
MSAKVHALTLYHYEGCPYCHRVRRFMDERGIRLALRDINDDPEARAELMRIGGKTQVPCLVIDGKALYESADIIRWLSEHFHATH